MAAQLDTNVKDDLKTQFVTREGVYRLLSVPEYPRPNRVGYTNNQNSPQVRVSVVSLPTPTTAATGSLNGLTNSITTATTTTSNHNLPANQLTRPPLAYSSNIAKASNISANGGNGGSGDGYDIQPAQLNKQQTAYVVPSILDARLGAGISMHTVTTHTSIGGSDGNGYDSNQVYGGDRLCFNFGRELYVYAFKGIKKGTELSKPVDKKFYKGTNPSCHDFNATTATPTGAPLLIGFTTGQIQLVSPQPGPRELRKLYNEERLIDKTKVTCLKWLPNSANLFLASHASGHLYLYNEDLPSATAAPNYQPYKVGDGYSVLTCKSKSIRNPLRKWVFSTENCCINEFCFSNCGNYLAIVSQDGFLRVFHYDTTELLGVARSYFGGFLCVCWSPDSKYIVVGGEDDLVTVWSFHERRVVARGQGHRSWVSVVAFDPYLTSYNLWEGGDFSDDENQMNEFGRFSCDSTAATNAVEAYGNKEKNITSLHINQRPNSTSFKSDASSLSNDKLSISYRLGSVGQDTQICLWDITEDILRHSVPLRQRVNSSNMNDTSYMNGGIDADGIKVIRPVAIGNATGSYSSPHQFNSANKDTISIITTTANNTAVEPISNSCSSKFSIANCTMSSQSSSANTPADEITASSSTNHACSSNKFNKNTGMIGGGNSIKFPNCIGATKSDSIDGNITGNYVQLDFSSSGYNSKTSNSGSSKSSDSTTGISAFNSLTQRFSNFNFLNSSSKKSSLNLNGGSTASHTRQNRKTLGLMKSCNHQPLTFANSTQMDTTNTQIAGNLGHNFGSLKLRKSSTQLLSNFTGAISSAANTHSSMAASTAHSYDPLKLIGTPACPRFEECPILEPLVCKKIAHERLCALIFREDCFLTACQDGFIYTWARPGYNSNISHLSPNQAAPPGGTVI